MKKFIRCFSLLLISAFIMSIFISKPVSANYDNSKNYVKITVGKKNAKVKLGVLITYQRGIEKSTAMYKVCYANDKDVITPEDCGSDYYKVDNSDENGWAPVITSGLDSDYIVKELAGEADKNPTSKYFSVDTGIPATSADRDNNFVVFVQTYFCAVRQASDAGYTSCQYWHDSTGDPNKQFTSYSFKVQQAIDNDIDIDVRPDYKTIGDEDLREMIATIGDIVERIVLPIIYVVLGIFFVIKGTITGVQIVKASDEPQIRQEKISSLKWLVIGVAIAYAASFTVGIITKILKNAFSIE